ISTTAFYTSGTRTWHAVHISYGDNNNMTTLPFTCREFCLYTLFIAGILWKKTEGNIPSAYSHVIIDNGSSYFLFTLMVNNNALIGVICYQGINHYYFHGIKTLVWAFKSIIRHVILDLWRYRKKRNGDGRK
ncbi:hypothetical protein ACJX0J_029135, partial [Zea mays]